MDHRQAIDYLDAHVGAGMQPGLERIRLLMETMGAPHEGYPIIHVAGTNGKTSTTRMAAVLLTAHGLNTGTYSSPHLEAVEERLGLNGRISTPDELALAVSDVAAFADVLEEAGRARFSYFELTTAMAFAFFAEHAVEAAVVEVGLGGRLDATNVVDSDVAVLTGVGLEHTRDLGPTVEAIAAEKLAIAKPASILVTGEVPQSVFDLASARARELGIEHRAFGRDFGVEAIRAVGGWLCDLRGAEAEYDQIHLPVHGRHQTRNAAVAVAAVESLLGRGLDHDAVVAGMAAFTSPGRMEPIRRDPLVLLDGAHNPEGFAALGAALEEEFPTTRWTLVVGVMEDKDLDAMLSHLGQRIESIIATNVESDRALPAAELAARAGVILGAPAEAIGDPAAAVEVAVRRVGADGAVLVAGSLYMVGAVRRSLAGQ